MFLQLVIEGEGTCSRVNVSIESVLIIYIYIYIYIYIISCRENKIGREIDLEEKEHCAQHFSLFH